MQKYPAVPNNPLPPHHTHSQTHKEYINDLQTKINVEIGYRFWKKYVNAAFWSYISLPINLSITMLTALSTGQATTDNLLPKSLYVNISLATLVISILNTYFRPYVQMNQNIEYMNKWSVLGYKFESIYYSETETHEQLDMRLSKYEELMKDINELKKQEILESQNFLTDSIHLALRSCVCCLKNKTSWLALDEELMLEAEGSDHSEPVYQINLGMSSAPFYETLNTHNNTFIANNTGHELSTSQNDGEGLSRDNVMYGPAKEGELVQESVNRPDVNNV